MPITNHSLAVIVVVVVVTVEKSKCNLNAWIPRDQTRETYTGKFRLNQDYQADVPIYVRDTVVTIYCKIQSPIFSE